MPAPPARSRGGELYPEALSKPGGVADSYVKMMRHNVELIAKSMK
ncbi:hypothetical protein KPNJ1_01213 [Klebsiella pneumoniae 30660/NJST258_1]|nr:hypothetical protein KPNJ1_01213 [Klebsiella pneumoniae 30660/NJST258_1]